MVGRTSGGQAAHWRNCLQYEWHTCIRRISAPTLWSSGEVPARRGELMDTLGVDIGGVIIERGEGSADTSFFSRHYLSTPMVPDAFDALRVLNAERFPGRVFLVSKCGARIQARTLA